MQKRSVVFLTLDKQIDLWHRWRGGDEMAGRAIYDSHENLIRKTARRYAKSYNVDQEDLFLAAREGFFEAMSRFDPERGTTIGTYAMNWMQERIDRNLREIQHVPKRNHTAITIQKEVTALLNNNPQWHVPISDIYNKAAAKLNMSPNDVRVSYEKSTRKTISLDTRLLGDEGDTLVDMLAGDYQDPLDAMQAEATSRILHQALESLDERSKNILKRRFGMTVKAELGEDSDKGATLETLGGEYSVSKERIRQIEQKALGNLRKALTGKLSAEMV